MNEHQTPDEDETPDDLLFVWTCAFELAIGLLALVLAGIIGVDARAYFPEWGQLEVWPIAKDLGVGMIAAIPIVVAVHFLFKIKHPAIESLQRLSDIPMMRALLELSTPELIVISFCAGIGEELAFRGFLVPWIASFDFSIFGQTNSYQVGESFTGASPLMIVIALVISSVLFGLVHPITKLYIAVAAFIGVYLGLLFLWTESLLVVIVAHGAYDAIQFLLAKRETSSAKETMARVTGDR
ncbi:MAG: CPBP family intramembrane glutamic endopeptidase [Planctomycetota bacterium]